MLSGEIFEEISRRRELTRQLGNIDVFVSPQVPLVENYALRKAKSLLSKKVECHIPGIRERGRFHGMIARQIIYSKTFGKDKIWQHAEMCVILGTYDGGRAQRPHLPRIAAGIGMDFINHIKEYNCILERLLEFSRPERNRLMEGIRLKGTFIDHYIGQFIFTQFRVHAPKLPRPPYGAVWWHR